MMPLRSFAIVATLFFATAASGQTPRFGVGTELMLSTANNVGIGFRGRVSMPVNADVSVAIGSGITGFALGGSDNARWVFTPQVSGIVTLEGVRQAPYILAGVGAYLPLGEFEGKRHGPTFHAGAGKVRVLRDVSLFYEVDPGIVIEKSRIDLIVPFRIGVIF